MLGDHVDPDKPQLATIRYTAFLQPKSALPDAKNRVIIDRDIFVN